MPRGEVWRGSPRVSTWTVHGYSVHTHTRTRYASRARARQNALAVRNFNKTLAAVCGDAGEEGGQAVGRG